MNTLFMVTKFLKRQPETMRDKTVKTIFSMIEKYSKWYDEHGLYLPPDYASDPSAWSEALHKMSRAFKLLIQEMNGEGELWEAKNKWKKYGEEDTEKIKELEAEIKEGLSLFGSQLFYLTDTEK